MPQQTIKGYDQINTGTVQRDNLDIYTPNKSVIRKIVSGTNLTIQYSGVDLGTGDVYLGVDAIPEDGWIPSNFAGSFLSADSPIFVMSVVGNITGSSGVGVGMKMRLAHLGQTKHFFVSQVTLTGAVTHLHLYGGTDFTLTTGSITDIYQSPVKAPYGFNINPDKWTQILTNTSNLTTGSPVQSQWYNLPPLSLSIPIGLWDVSWEGSLRPAKNASTSISQAASLSNSASSESDSKFTKVVSYDGASGNLVLSIGQAAPPRPLLLTTKTTYFLIIKSDTASMGSIAVRGDAAATVIKAVCGFL